MNEHQDHRYGRHRLTHTQHSYNISMAKRGNYCSLSKEEGMEGKTGHIYVQQAEIILQISPDAAIIEQTDNVTNVHDSKEVNLLTKKLSQD